MLNRFRSRLATLIAPAMTPTGQRLPLARPYSQTADLRYLLSAVSQIPYSDEGLALAAHASVWAYRAMTIRAQEVGRMDWYVEDESGQRLDKSAWHNAMEYAYSRFNQNLLFLQEASMVCFGETYLEKLYNPMNPAEPGGVRRLNNLGIRPEIQGGLVMYYEYSNDNETVYYAPDVEVVMDKLVNMSDDLRGHAPLVTALRSVNVMNSMLEYIQAFFLNDATPGGLISLKQDVTLSDENRKDIIEQWTAQLKTVSNSFGTILLPFPLEYKTFEPTPPTSQIALSEEQKNEILAVLGVPVTMVSGRGDSDPLSANSTLDRQTINFYEQTIFPRCDETAKFWNTHLMQWLAPGLTLKYDASRITNVISQTNERWTMLGAAYRRDTIMTMNEARDQMGQEPVEGGDFFVFSQDMVIVPAHDLANANQYIQEARQTALQNDPFVYGLQQASVGGGQSISATPAPIPQLPDGNNVNNVGDGEYPPMRPDETTLQAKMDELSAWRKYQTRRITKSDLREFEAINLPRLWANDLKACLKGVSDLADMHDLVTLAEMAISEGVMTSAAMGIKAKAEVSADVIADVIARFGELGYQDLVQAAEVEAEGDESR